MSPKEIPDLLYLELDDVLALYADLFELDEQGARDRLRNEDGLSSALHRPRSYAHYINADVATQGAALAHAIAEGQPFLEGNKRIALIALRTFLAINGYYVTVSQEERADWMISLSRGQTVEQLSDRIRAALRALPPSVSEQS
ncbi:MAG TPA: type II toxin-antitoxin system death-on-curing family toxin [Chloroflexota bacterium]